MAERIYNALGFWFRNQFFIQKLNTPLGFIGLGVMALAIAFAIALLGIKGGMILMMSVLAIPMVGACLFSPMFGISLSMVMGILIGLLTKYANMPFGLSLDVLLFVMFFGLLVRQVKERDMSFAKSPVSVIILIWVFYNLIQVLNPVAGSRMAWIFTVRTMAGLILLYFIACSALDSLGKIKFILKFIIFLGLISALYGLKQEFLGFTSQEMTWLRADEKRYQLIVQWSRIRIFSFFSDPTNYGIFMAYMGTFCLVLARGPFSWLKRGILLFCSLLMYMAMAFAGSRTPFILVPFGLCIFTLMTIKKEVIIGMTCMAMVAGAFILKSTSNAVVYRIQSAFLLDKSDDTMQVRYQNQRIIRPFIYSHPFGAGLGSTGIWGKRFTPNSFLAKFPHDSAFVRVAVELGWIGLIIFGTFIFVLIRTSVYYYLRVESPFIKVVYLAITVVIFMLTLASYPQEAIPILPTSVIFYTLLGVMVRLKDFDPRFRKEDQPAEKPLISFGTNVDH